MPGMFGAASRRSLAAAALRGALALALSAAVSGCLGQATPTPTASASPTTTPTPDPTPTPSPTPPPLSLDLPDVQSSALVEFVITPGVPSEVGGIGQIFVTVTNVCGDNIDEVVLRWPTDLDQTLFLAPFIPGPERLTLLVVPWTKWVVGPGSRGEPAGTTSLGWGPLDAGSSVDIPIYATRMAPGAVGFDLQVLDGEAIVQMPSGQLAETRVEIGP